MNEHTTLYALLAGYGFGLLTAFMAAAVYETSPAVLMAAALSGLLMTVGATAGNERKKRAPRKDR